MTSTAVATARGGRRLVLADLVPGSRVRDVVLVVCAAALVGVAAQLSFPVPGTPVPVTGQTFAVLLSGAVLGWRRELAAMGLYLVAGMLGVPWFAGASSGIHSPSLGYLIGFLLAGSVVGAIAGRGGDRTPLRTLLTMAVGTVLIYAVGVPYLIADLHVGFGTAWSLGVQPFLLGDAVKLLLAAGMLPGAWWLIRRGENTGVHKGS